MTKETNTKQHIDLAQNVLDRIEKEDITPLSRVVYVFENICFWVLWSLSVLFGALAVSVLIFTELNIGWEFYEMTHDNALTFFVHTLPYVWIVLFLIVILLGPYNLKHTKQGYRYSLGMIMLLGLGLSILFGVLLNTYGFGKIVDESIGMKLPLHTPALRMREQFWMQPERGIYNGTVEIIDRENGVITILTTEGKSATFLLSFLPQKLIDLLETNAHVHILATSSATYEDLVACRLMLWEEEIAESIGDVRDRRRQLSDFFEMELENEELDRDRLNPCNSQKRERPHEIFEFEKD